MEAAEKKYLCGFLEVHPTYAIYVTDVARVWEHVPEEEAVRRTARAVNVADFDRAKMAFLVLQFGRVFEHPQKTLHLRETEGKLVMRTQISGALTWKFLFDAF